MTFNRVTFFFVLLAVVLLPFLIHKFTWLAGSKKTIGTMRFIDQNHVIYFLAGNDSFWFTGNSNIIFKEGEKVPVRYQVNDPGDARIDVFAALWKDTLVYGGIPVIILIVIFLDHRIIPFGSTIKLQKRKPFLLIKHIQH